MTRNPTHPEIIAQQSHALRDTKAQLDRTARLLAQAIGNVALHRKWLAEQQAIIDAVRAYRHDPLFAIIRVRHDDGSTSSLFEAIDAVVRP